LKPHHVATFSRQCLVNKRWQRMVCSSMYNITLNGELSPQNTAIASFFSRRSVSTQLTNTRCLTFSLFSTWTNSFSDLVHYASKTLVKFEYDGFLQSVDPLLDSFAKTAFPSLKFASKSHYPLSHILMHCSSLAPSSYAPLSPFPSLAVCWTILWPKCLT